MPIFSNVLCLTQLGLESSLSLSLSLVIAIYPTTTFATGLAQHDWPTWGGNSAHNKISPSTNKNPLTIYLRGKAGNAAVPTFAGGNGLVIANNTIYGIWRANNIIGVNLGAYDLRGNQKWSVLLPSTVAATVAGMAVADDGTIYVGYGIGLNAYDTTGNAKFTNGCGVNMGNSAIRMPVIAHNGMVILQTGNNGDILACDPATGSLLYRTNFFPTGGGGQGNGGVAIDSLDNIYFHNQRGTQSIRVADGSEVWRIPGFASNAIYNNYALSFDEKLLAISAVDEVDVMDVNTKKLVFSYRLDEQDVAFTVGLSDRLYVSADVGTLKRPFTGKVCALDIVTRKELWCVPTLDHVQLAQMLVDSNNAIYLKDPTEHSLFSLDADGKLQWKYIDSMGVNSNDSPAMTDNGSLFYADDYLYGFRPWTLTPTAIKKPAATSTAVYFTVQSSMLRRDPQDGVSSDNRVQVRLDGGTTIPLKYLHQDGDDSVWEGIYIIPNGTDLSHVYLKGQIEAIANQTSSALITHFASVPGGFNNTGMVQSFDLGSVDKLPGTAAQSTVAPTDDFTQVYQATVSWIRDTSRTVWSYLKQTYVSIADFVMR